MHRLTNGDVEVVVSTEFGPRVLEYRRRGGDNVLQRLPDSAGQPTPFGDEWHNRGGHRLWYAPEERVRTYYPDNAPVAVHAGERHVRLTQPIEPHTRLQKELCVDLAERGSHARVTHRIRNHGAFEVELAVWGLSVVRQGGCALLPQAPFAPHPDVLAPARPLVMWSFTRMSDARIVWGDRFIRVRQDPQAHTPQKVGGYDVVGFGAYASDGEVFIVRHTPLPGPHADFGCNQEVFVDGTILELETLGPLVRVAPHAVTEHVETWSLDPFELDAWSAKDDELEGTLRRLV